MHYYAGIYAEHVSTKWNAKDEIKYNSLPISPALVRTFKKI